MDGGLGTFGKTCEDIRRAFAQPFIPASSAPRGSSVCYAPLPGARRSAAAGADFGERGENAGW